MKWQKWRRFQHILRHQVRRNHSTTFSNTRTLYSLVFIIMKKAVRQVCSHCVTLTCIMEVAFAIYTMLSMGLTLVGTLKLQSIPLWNNTVIGTLAVDGWAVTFGTTRGIWAGCGPAQSLLAIPNVTAHPSTASVPASFHSIWHCKCLCTIKG